MDALTILSEINYHIHVLSQQEEEAVQGRQYLALGLSFARSIIVDQMEDNSNYLKDLEKKAKGGGSFL